MVRIVLENSGTIKNKTISDIIELQKKIIRVLRENNGEMEVTELCDLLGIDSYEVPWGYYIGWAKCLQSNQKWHLVLSDKGTDDDIGYTGVM